jgi:MFS family permease
MMGNIGIIGNFIGLWFAGYGTARWGYRPMYIFGMVLMTAMVFLFVFCQSLAMLIVSQTLVNVPWGIFREWSLTTFFGCGADSDRDFDYRVCSRAVPNSSSGIPNRFRRHGLEYRTIHLFFR